MTLGLGAPIRINADAEQAPAWALALLASVEELRQAVGELAGAEPEEEEGEEELEAEELEEAEGLEPLAHNPADTRVRQYQRARRRAEIRALDQRELYNAAIGLFSLPAPAVGFTSADRARLGWRQ